MTMADEVDSQLTQAMTSSMGVVEKPVAALAVTYHGRSRIGRSDQRSRQILGSSNASADGDSTLLAI
jgi:hypothetical protein